MKSYFYLLILVILPFRMLAQQDSMRQVPITGIWKGMIVTTDKQLPYEIAISESEGKFTGYSYTTYTVNATEMIAVRTMKIKVENNKITTQDDDLLYNNFDKTAPKQIRQTNTLVFQAEGKMLKLTGIFSTKRTREFRELTGNVELQKENDINKTLIAPKLEEMKLLSSMSFLQPESPDILLAKATIPLEKIPAEKKLSPKPVIIQTNTTHITVTPIPKEISTAVNIPKEKQPVIEKTVRQVPIPVAKTKVTIPVKTPSKPVPVAKATAIVKKENVIATKSAPPVIVSPPKAPVTTATFTEALAKREIETIQTVYFKSDSLILTLYDNGTVDGDTVSVILDGRMIMPKQGLSTRPVTKTINVPPGSGDSMQLVMYAENLGSIAPNTGLLIINDGSDRYEIRFAGDLQKNAAIILRRKNPSP